MQHLTARIMESSGVVVDYIGDGLLAMWNAPLEQPDHAALACRAALAMRDGLPELNRRWEGRLGKPIGLGIGINSGAALVGNTGSHQKFKYGPLGHTVNLASRVEGATKHLGVSLLLTGSTRNSLGSSFATRRLCRARVVGISRRCRASRASRRNGFARVAAAARVVRASARALRSRQVERGRPDCFSDSDRRQRGLRLTRPDSAGPGRRMPQVPSGELRPGSRAKVQVIARRPAKAAGSSG